MDKQVDDTIFHFQDKKRLNAAKVSFKLKT